MPREETMRELIRRRPTTTMLVPIQCSSGIVETCGGGGMYERWEVVANAAQWELDIASNDEVGDSVEK
jgi:hypothetical protein